MKKYTQIKRMVDRMLLETANSNARQDINKDLYYFLITNLISCERSTYSSSVGTTICEHILKTTKGEYASHAKTKEA